MNVIEFKARDNSLFINQQLLINLVNWAHHSRSLFILRIAALEKTLWDEPKNILRCQDVRDLPSFSRLHTVAILIDIISRLRLNQFPSLRKSNFFIANWWWEREVIFICFACANSRFISHQHSQMNETYQHPGKWHDQILHPSMQRFDSRTFIMSYIIIALEHNSVYEVMVQAKNMYGWNEVSSLEKISHLYSILCCNMTLHRKLWRGWWLSEFSLCIRTFFLNENSWLKRLKGIVWRIKVNEEKLQN